MGGAQKVDPGYLAPALQHQIDVAHGPTGAAFGLPSLFDGAGHAAREARDCTVNNGVLLLRGPDHAGEHRDRGRHDVGLVGEAGALSQHQADTLAWRHAAPIGKDDDLNPRVASDCGFGSQPT